MTAMVTLLAAIAAAATQRGGVVMSNEHSSSAVPNLRWSDLEVNHQWSKSFGAEHLDRRGRQRERGRRGGRGELPA